RRSRHRRGRSCPAAGGNPRPGRGLAQARQPAPRRARGRRPHRRRRHGGARRLSETGRPAMIRVVVYLILVGALAAGAVWVADRPGDVTVTWQGMRIETSVMVMLIG